MDFIFSDFYITLSLIVLFLTTLIELLSFSILIFVLKDKLKKPYFVIYLILLWWFFVYLLFSIYKIGIILFFVFNLVQYLYSILYFNFFGDHQFFARIAIPQNLFCTMFYKIFLVIVLVVNLKMFSYFFQYY